MLVETVGMTLNTPNLYQKGLRSRLRTGHWGYLTLKSSIHVFMNAPWFTGAQSCCNRRETICYFIHLLAITMAKHLELIIRINALILLSSCSVVFSNDDVWAALKCLWCIVEVVFVFISLNIAHILLWLNSSSLFQNEQIRIYWWITYISVS